jgi:surface protein
VNQCESGEKVLEVRRIPENPVVSEKKQYSAEECYQLGQCYLWGMDGTPKDEGEAIKYYRKAVEQGHVKAQYFLGWCYQYGKGVKLNYSEAVKWYRKAAEQGHAGAQYFLGWHYENGKGIKKNILEAVKWYRAAAEQGNELAKTKLKKLDNNQSPERVKILSQAELIQSAENEKIGKKVQQPRNNNILKSDYGNSVFGNTAIGRSFITSITFRNTLANMPCTAWDASAAQDGSVMAWLENKSELVIAGKGGVTAGRSCAGMFSTYKNVTYIYFNGCFATSCVTNMRNMFIGCSALRVLDMEGFDTSNVTDMSNMFYGCRVLYSIGGKLHIPEGCRTDAMYAYSGLKFIST